VKKKHIGTILLSLMSIAIIAAFVYYLYRNADQYRKLLQFSTTSILLLVAISIVLPIFNGMINTYMCRSLGANISQREGFLLASASTLANQLPISGGIVTKAVYLKQKYDLAYTKNISAMLALFFCSVAVYGLLGLTILLSWLIFSHIPVSPVLFIAFGLMACSLIIFWLPVDRIRIPKTLLKWVQQALEGWLLISKDPKLLLQLMGLQTTTMLLLAARYWLAFHMLSQNVTISQAVLFASASILTILVSFAPGGLGVREAIVGTLATTLGFKTGVSIVAIELDRLVATVVVVLIGWVSAVILGKQISETMKEPENQQT
jgi:uncharacterized membrane protein YbhN (UPF0104 family)